MTTVQQQGFPIKFDRPFYLSPDDSTERALNSNRGHVVLRAGGVVEHLLTKEVDNSRRELPSQEGVITLNGLLRGLAVQRQLDSGRSPTNVLDALLLFSDGATLGVLAGALHSDVASVRHDLEQLVSIGVVNLLEVEPNFVFALAG